MPKQVFCSECEFFNPVTFLVTKGERNVSGGLAVYRRWLNPCRNEHELSEDYHCVFYEPNAAKRLREKKYNQEIKQLMETVNA